MLSEILAGHYGLSLRSAVPVHKGTDTVSWRAESDDGLRLRIKEYSSLTPDDIQHLRTVWDMSEYCRAADLPVPRVWTINNGRLFAVEGGRAWAVTDEAPGSASTKPMTVDGAEQLGLLLGKMHRVLAAYPLLKWRRPARWHTRSVEEGVARCNRALKGAVRQHEPHLPQVRQDLEQRREDLRRYTRSLRASLPHDLVEQALHADVTPTNVLTQAGKITALVGFRAETAICGWELGRAAFDPRTVADGSQWVQCAVRMIQAYRSQNPSLPHPQIQATARIALLHMLFSFYGATTAEYALPDEERTRLQQHWMDQQLAIRRLLTNLDDLEPTLAATNGGR
ncbi:phosphotransferase [Streptomyces sp. NBC_01381]|uniref:phosphotransferase enzyme family protein n=1 Tax=Streptomyces sp. NBC_01381 TaxID=2903845 RepID=UPI0022582276|nr:phosphotransferase [Streptomyces sp. NBC_01381]MCX4666472.1 phosphotransferase [Streptomyces sp. NBC_01381]